MMMVIWMLLIDNGDDDVDEKVEDDGW